MKNLIFVLFFLVCLGILYYGNFHYHNKTTEMVSKASQKYENENKVVEKKLVQNKNKSVVDWIKYKAFTNSVVSIDILGSSVTKGWGASSSDKDWGSLLTSYLDSKVDSTVALTNRGYGGYTTSRLLKEDKISTVIKDNPDIVIFEITTINNFDHGISVKQTEAESKEIVDRLKKQLPNSLIIVQNSHQIDKLAYRTYNKSEYDNFNNQIANFALSQGWNFINVYQEYQNVVNKNNLNPSKLLYDGIHPNDKGYDIWFNILKKHFLSDKINR